MYSVQQNSRANNPEDNDINVYDPIDFDDPMPTNSIPKSKKLVRKPIPSPGEVSRSWAAPPPVPHKKPLAESPRRDDDVASLDSYEDMNSNDGNLIDEETKSNKKASKPLPDPRTRPQVSCLSGNKIHMYTLIRQKSQLHSSYVIPHLFVCAIASFTTFPHRTNLTFTSVQCFSKDEEEKRSWHREQTSTARTFRNAL